MALLPHKLDDVFKNINNAEQSFLDDSDVKEAFAKAKAKYLETENFISEKQQYCGPSPSQSARAAFLQTLL